jgi:DNA mismatch repair ATPase MutS
MRHKATAKKSNEAKTGKSDEPKIVNRELKQVFTNGTIVDGAYLTTDDANHCVAIKVIVPSANGSVVANPPCRNFGQTRMVCHPSVSACSMLQPASSI